MNPRLFRLIEKHQRIDDLLRGAEERADRSETDRLWNLKIKAKQLIDRLTVTPALA